MKVMLRHVVVALLLCAGAAVIFSHSSLSMQLPQPPAPAMTTRLVLMDRQGTVTPVGMLPSTTFAPRISPDGKRIAFDAGGAIWIADLSNVSGMRQLPKIGPVSNFPLWYSNDRIFVISTPSGFQELFLQNVDGSGTPELVASPARAPESWSERIQRLSFITLKGTHDYDVASYSFQDKKAAPLIAKEESAQLSSRFSHDGKWIAYESDETGAYEIYVQPFPLTNARVKITPKGGRRPVWSLDDKEMFFDDGTRLFVMKVLPGASFAVSEPTPLPITGFVQGQLRRQYDMTADGRFLMMIRQTP